MPFVSLWRQHRIQQVYVYVTALLPRCLISLQSYQLLNCDDHANYLLKHKKDPALYRPDITHQVGSSSSSSGDNGLASASAAALSML
jgi:hypothetical protein